MTVETSIVIRTLNESKHLGTLLQGIHDQDYQDWEIVLVDSGSTDGTVDIARRYGARIFHIPKEEFTFGRSLNLGCRQAQGRYLAFASGHVLPITNNWLRNLVKPFQDASVAMVYGRQRGTDSNRLSELRDLDTNFGPASNILVDEAKANNGNSAIRRELWLDQPFDEALPGLEDVDWARKVEAKSYRVYYAADAAVYHIHEETLRQHYRRYQREAAAAKQMFPYYRLTWSDFARGLPYFIVRDFLYAFRVGKRRKVFQVPATRAAQFLGMYNGVRYQKQLGRDLVCRVDVPESHSLVVIQGPGRHGLERAPLPRLESDQVLVQVAFVDVRPADFQLANGHSTTNSGVTARYPLVPGQAYCGIIVQRGAKAGRFRKGQKVAGFATGCGSCPDCTAGDYHQCVEAENGGGPSVGGTYAQYLAVPSDRVYGLPSDMPLKHGAMIGSIVSCLRGLSRPEVRTGSSACVLGAGPLGNLCAQLLHSRGVKVTAVDRRADWLTHLQKYDINTLSQLGAVDKYDYLIRASGDRDGQENLANQSQSSSMPICLDIISPARVPSAKNSVSGSEQPSQSITSNQDHDWREATRLVHRRLVNLEEHTACVEPLEAYEKAWASAEAEERFNILICPNKELEVL